MLFTWTSRYWGRIYGWLSHRFKILAVCYYNINGIFVGGMSLCFIAFNCLNITTLSMNRNKNHLKWTNIQKLWFTFADFRSIERTRLLCYVGCHRYSLARAPGTMHRELNMAQFVLIVDLVDIIGPCKITALIGQQKKSTQYLIKHYVMLYSIICICFERRSTRSKWQHSLICRLGQLLLWWLIGLLRQWWLWFGSDFYWQGEFRFVV